jgi:hypothetical protein
LIGVAERREMRRESESFEKKRIENIAFLYSSIDTPTPKKLR